MNINVSAVKGKHDAFGVFTVINQGNGKTETYHPCQ